MRTYFRFHRFPTSVSNLKIFHEPIVILCLYGYPLSCLPSYVFTFIMLFIYPSLFVSVAIIPCFKPSNSLPKKILLKSYSIPFLPLFFFHFYKNTRRVSKMCFSSGKLIDPGSSSFKIYNFLIGFPGNWVDSAPDRSLYWKIKNVFIDYINLIIRMTKGKLE